MDKVEISKNKKDIDINIVADYLSKESYWAKNRSVDVIERSIENSICYSMLLENNFIGFARIITDKATFSYLCDVFVLKQFQGKGFGKQLLDYIINDDELKNTKIYLMTFDAHKFYEQYGFESNEEIKTRIMRRVPK